MVPAYNAATTIGATLSGLLNQTYSPLEIVVVDDGSTDATSDVVRSYKSAVRFIQQPNRGVSAARNAAIQQCRGEFVAWNDADDTALPRYVDAMLRTYFDSGAGQRIVTSEALILSPAGVTGRRLLPKYHPPPHRQRMHALQETFVGAMCLYPRSLHDELGMLDETIGHGEDRDLWLRAIFSGWVVIRQPEPQALYRWVGGSASAQVAAMAAGEERILRKLWDDPVGALTTKECDYLALRFSMGSPRELISRGDMALRTGEQREAATYLTAASQLRPADKRLAIRALAARATPLAWLLARLLRRQDRRLGWHKGMIA